MSTNSQLRYGKVPASGGQHGGVWSLGEFIFIDVFFSKFADFVVAIQNLRVETGLKSKQIRARVTGNRPIYLFEQLSRY